MFGLFGNSQDEVPIEAISDFNPRDNKDLWYNTLTTEVCKPTEEGDRLVPIAFKDEIHEGDDGVEFGTSHIGLPSEVDYLGVKVFDDGSHEGQFILGRRNTDNESGGLDEKHLKRFSLNQLPGRMNAIKRFLFQER